MPIRPPDPAGPPRLTSGQTAGTARHNMDAGQSDKPLVKPLVKPPVKPLVKALVKPLVKALVKPRTLMEQSSLPEKSSSPSPPVGPLA